MVCVRGNNSTLLGQSALRPSSFPWPLVLVLLALLLEGGCKRRTQATDYSHAQSLSIELRKVNRQHGLSQVAWDNDGSATVASVEGAECRRIARNGPNRAYMYFTVDPSFKTDYMTDVKLTVEYFDSPAGSFDIQYDGYDPNGKSRKSGAYTSSRKHVTQTGTRAWMTETFELKDARFDNRQNGHADFRIRLLTSELYIRSVALTRQQP
jgi:hypothetical protein